MIGAIVQTGSRPFRFAYGMTRSTRAGPCASAGTASTAAARKPRHSIVIVPRSALWSVQQAAGSLHRTKNFGAGGQFFPIFQKEVMKFFVTPVTFDRHTDGCQ